MMVMMMVHSNTGQLTNHVVNLRTGLDGVNRNNDVGPESAGKSFFLPPAAGGGAEPAGAPAILTSYPNPDPVGVSP